MKTQHELLMENPEYRRLFAIESLTAEASELIARVMAEQNLSKADLARKLGKSRSWITQLLRGNANITVSTLAEVANAMDVEIRLQTQPVNAGSVAGSSNFYTFETLVQKLDRGKPEKDSERRDDLLRPGYAA